MKHNIEKEILKSMYDLDNRLFTMICNDITNGSLLTGADDETLEMLLTGLWEHMEDFKDVVVIGMA